MPAKSITPVSVGGAKRSETPVSRQLHNSAALADEFRNALGGFETKGGHGAITVIIEDGRITRLKIETSIKV